MKILIICGIDRLGKDTQIEKIYNEYKDKYNISIRHFSVPNPKDNENSLMYQFKSFDNEIDYLNNISMMEKQFGYYNKENLIIYNRFYLGELVYGTLYRNHTLFNILDNIIKPLENRLLKFVNFNNILTLLFYTDNVDIIMDDGKSLSNGDISKIKSEQNLFKYSLQHTKFNYELVKVNDENKFKSKDDIFDIIKNKINTFLIYDECCGCKTLFS